MSKIQHSVRDNGVYYLLPDDMMRILVYSHVLFLVFGGWNNNFLIFVEVKTRKNSNYGYPESFLSEPQQERIHLAAEEYVFQNEWQGEVRFDIISILWDGDKPTLDHFEDAF